jgi:hypothetical protein
MRSIQSGQEPSIHAPLILNTAVDKQGQDKPADAVLNRLFERPKAL